MVGLIKGYALTGCPVGCGAVIGSYRVEVSLVDLLHGALQLTALRLPLLEVAHGLHGGPLPGGGARVVVHVVDPAAVVYPPLPAKNTVTLNI